MRLEVPWGWVLISAYCTALMCVGVSQVVGADTIITVVRDFQTLIAGLATVAALFIAVQQLKRQNRRDAVDAVRYYEPEIEALRSLSAEVTRIVRTSSGLVYALSGGGVPISLNPSYWDRLAAQINANVAPSVIEVREAVDEYNSHYNSRAFLPSLTGFDIHELDGTRAELHRRCSTLQEKIESRYQEIDQLIKVMS